MRTSFVSPPIPAFLSTTSFLGAVLHTVVFSGCAVVLTLAPDIDQVSIAFYLPIISALFLLPFMLLISVHYTPSLPFTSRAMVASAGIGFTACILLFTALCFGVQGNVKQELVVLCLLIGHGVWIVIASIISLHAPLTLPKLTAISGILAGSLWIFFSLCLIGSELNRLYEFGSFIVPDMLLPALVFTFLIIYSLWGLQVSWQLFQRQMQSIKR